MKSNEMKQLLIKAAMILIILVLQIEMSFAGTVSSPTKIAKERVSNVVTLPIEDYKGLVGFAKKCNTYAEECGSRVAMYEQYEVAAEKQIDELNKYAAKLEVENKSRPDAWTVFGLSLLTGIILGAGGYHYAR